jgi:hypothetical protein
VKRCYTKPGLPQKYLVSWFGLGPENNTIEDRTQVRHSTAYAKISRKETRLNEQGWYYADGIIDCQYVDGVPYYLVQWKGYSFSESTCEPYKHVKHLRGWNFTERGG